MAMVLLTKLMASTPKKFMTTAKPSACFGDNARVAGQLATALGASVQPLTNIAATTARTAAARAGDPRSRFQKSINECAIIPPLDQVTSLLW